MKPLDAVTGSVSGQLSHGLLLRLVLAALDSLFGGLQKSLELALKTLDMKFGLKHPGGGKKMHSAFKSFLLCPMCVSHTSNAKISKAKLTS